MRPIDECPTIPPPTAARLTQRLGVIEGLRNVLGFLAAGVGAVLMFLIGRWPAPPRDSGGRDIGT